MTPQKLISLLKDVEKPTQYLGNEVNAIHKDFSKQKVRVCLVFPDAYEMGMSHMGQKILYDILNNIEGVVAERCFAPLKDFEKKLRFEKEFLFSLESKTPLKSFDVIAISVPYELTYTNLLNILDLGGIPIWQKDRKGSDPLVITGGTGSYNPEPYADFVDAVGIGDGEEMIVEIIDRVWSWKEKLKNRAEILNELSAIEGVYVPSFFKPIYNDDGTLKEMKALKENYTGVKKRIVKNLNDQPYPTNLVVPNIKLIHDRIGIEIQRGCTRMCRFCQAGYIERPTRQRSPEKVLEIADKSYEQTGIDEISLLSLSAGDYQTIVPTLKALNRRFAGQKVAISVPATRTETLTPELIEQVKKVRKTGFTIAPEAGSERMRRVINKGNKVENLIQACRNAFSAGYELIKFYYLCGLPFERDEDLLGIAQEAGQALDIGLEYTKHLQINVSVSSLVPKPFTPFQWSPQETMAENRRKLHLIKTNFKDKRLRFKCHDAEMSLLEGLFARGDRRLSQVLFQAYQNGCRFDEWGEHLRFDLWQKTFAEKNLDLDFYLHRERQREEVLPWDHLFIQMKKEWLWKEFEAARQAAFVADCSVDKCAQFCGVCDFKEIKNKIYVIDENEIAAKKGNREWYGRFGQVNVGASFMTPFADDDCDPNTNAMDGKGAINCAPTSERFKLRVHFSKTKWAALMGHLELMNVLKRAILRTEVEVAYSEGFHPQMRLSMGYALSLGIESTCESFDLILNEGVDLKDFETRLQVALPGGLHVLKVEEVDLHETSLYSQTKAIEYEVEFLPEIPQPFLAQWQKTISKLNDGEEIFYTRVGFKKKKGRTEKKFLLNRMVRFSEDYQINERRFGFATLLDPKGSLKPIEVVLALSGLSEAVQKDVAIRKVGVQYC